MERLTRYVLAHRRLVVLLWLVAAIAGVATMPATGDALSRSFSLPGMSSYDATHAIQQLTGTGGDERVELLVVSLPARSGIHSPEAQRQLAALLARVQRDIPRARIASYLSQPASNLFLSADRRTTYAAVFLPHASDAEDVAAQQAQLQHAVRGMRIAGAPVYVTGVDELQQAGTPSSGPSTLAETAIGALGALLVLALIFGSLHALIPLLIALVAIPSAFLALRGLTLVTEVSFIVQFLVALIGLGVAIDYSLLIVMRWREERLKHASADEAVVAAMRMAGRAVLVSGGTAAVGLVTLVALPMPFLRSIGFGGLLIPIISLLAALTLLPVLLASCGNMLDWPRPQQYATSDFWSRWGAGVVRHRWLAAGSALIVLGVLAAPALSLRLSNPRSDSLAGANAATTGLRLLEQAGIPNGVFSPFEVLVQGANPNVVACRLAQVEGMLGAVAPSDARWRPAGSTIVFAVPIAEGISPAWVATYDRVRAAAVHEYPRGAVRVGGDFAVNEDFIRTAYGNLPPIIGCISLVTLLMLARAFRSVLLPIKAILLDLLSVAVTLGCITVIWQEGHGAALLGGGGAMGSIMPYIPILVFAFLFGLTIDYEVFILARVREDYDRKGDTNAAIASGLGSTGRLVTGAALILFLAFCSLATAPDPDIKVTGSALAIGILLDATVVRMLLVPALFALCGGWNWWCPALLRRVLRLPGQEATSGSRPALRHTA